MLTDEVASNQHLIRNENRALKEERTVCVKLCQFTPREALKPQQSLPGAEWSWKTAMLKSSGKISAPC